VKTICSIDVGAAFLKQECMAYWNKNIIFILKTSLYVQEDISSWNSRLRRSQVSYLLSLCSYLQTLVINVFCSVWRFHITAQSAFVFLCVFCFVCFRSRSHPVPHRGERVKQGTVHSEILRLLCQRIFSSVLEHAVKIPTVVHLTWLKFSATFVRPRAVIKLWRNWTFVAITEIFKTSVQTQI